MRKRDIIAENSKLFSRLESAELKVKELSEQVKALSEKNAELERTVSELRGEIPQIDKEKIKTPLKRLEFRVAENAGLNNMVKYSAHAIGEIVMISAKCKAALGEDARVEVVSERVENAKSEILSVVSGAEGKDYKKMRIDKITKDTVDFINGIMD